MKLVHLPVAALTLTLGPHCHRHTQIERACLALAPLGMSASELLEVSAESDDATPPAYIQRLMIPREVVQCMGRAIGVGDKFSFFEYHHADHWYRPDIARWYVGPGGCGCHDTAYIDALTGMVTRMEECADCLLLPPE
jgi:hypothetical protein